MKRQGASPAWATELQQPGFRLSFKVRRTLLRRRSPFQSIAVYETHDYGTALFLDDIVQTTTVDEFAYHEMLAHVPLAAHPCPRHVLITGGGDGGTLREVLRHDTVERCDLVEIDEEVTRAAQAYLPGLATGFADARARVHFVDGVVFVRDCVPETYDAVLVDAPDPVGPAGGLFTAEFYAGVRRALRPGGLMCVQSESPFLHGELLRRIHRNVSITFPVVRVYLTTVPSYPGALWSFTVATAGPTDPCAPSPAGTARLAGAPLRYYSPSTHRAAFALPPFTASLLNAGGVGKGAGIARGAGDGKDSGDE